MSEGFVKPAMVVTHFHSREGDHVGDFGSGSGHFLKPLSMLVGKEGKVYACEIQKALVDALDKHVMDERITNVQVLWGDLEAINGTKIPDGVLDAGVLSNVLFQIEDKDILFKEIARTMRKGGKLFVIDWTSSFAGLGPREGDVVTEEQVKQLAAPAGFVFERSFSAGDHHYGISLRKE